MGQEYLPNLRKEYNGPGVPTQPEEGTQWARSTYPTWGWNTMAQEYLPNLRMEHNGPGVPTQTEDGTQWPRSTYPTWGWNTMARSTYPTWGWNTMALGCDKLVMISLRSWKAWLLSLMAVIDPLAVWSVKYMILDTQSIAIPSTFLSRFVTTASFPANSHKYNI